MPRSRKTPPRDSPRSRARSMAARMASAGPASSQATEESSTATQSTLPASAKSAARARTSPIATTRPLTVTPSWERRALQTAPPATLPTVSRALARSRTLRMSSNPYLARPARSACPGRGTVTIRPAPSPWSEGDISRSQFAWSLFSTMIEIGDPNVNPSLTPARNRAPPYLDAHTSTPAVPLLTPRQIAIDLLDGERDTGGNAFQNAHFRGTVRLSGCRQVKLAHPRSLTIPCSRMIPRVDVSRRADGSIRSGDLFVRRLAFSEDECLAPVQECDDLAGRADLHHLHLPPCARDDVTCPLVLERRAIDGESDRRRTAHSSDGQHLQRMDVRGGGRRGRR